MKKKYFVMLSLGDGGICVMTDSDAPQEGTVAMFESYEAAESCAKHNPLAQSYGYEIFKRGEGIKEW